MGTPLYIFLNRTFAKNEEFIIFIEYSTTGENKGINLLSKEMTCSKKYPLFFTECTAIGARSTFPCQVIIIIYLKDTPSAKVTINAKITVEEPFVGLFSGIYKSDYETNSDKFDNYTIQQNRTFEYIQKIPISTYLIVFAVGVLEFVKISERSGVWCEPILIEKCKEHFSDLEIYIQTGESLLNEFVWEQFNILILPKYKYWGMENPNLTYINSNAMQHKFVIFHELCHSWTGNLITNSTWENFWINEGFTTFLERKFVCIFLGEDEFKLKSENGYKHLLNVIDQKGIDHEHTCLNPQFRNVNIFIFILFSKIQWKLIPLYLMKKVTHL